jgi:hypothetical protein
MTNWKSTIHSRSDTLRGGHPDPKAGTVAISTALDIEAEYQLLFNPNLPGCR